MIPIGKKNWQKAANDLSFRRVVKAKADGEQVFEKAFVKDQSVMPLFLRT